MTDAVIPADTIPAVAAPAAHSPAPSPIAGLTLLPQGVAIASPGARIGAVLLDGVLMAFTLYIGWFIWSMVTWSKGQSPAKQLLSLRVIKAENGRVATWGQMFVREILVKTLLIGLLLSVFTLGILPIVSAFMVFGATRQTLHDKISGTGVVADPTKVLVP